MIAYPSGDIDRRLLRHWHCLGGIDEVGRGAIAGPLAVGIVVIDEKSGPPPTGIADSKMLSPAARTALVDPIREWALASAIGWASTQEVSELRMTRALRLASLRAYALVATTLEYQGLAPVGAVLLDGRYDFLSEPEQKRLIGEVPLTIPDPWAEGNPDIPVATMARADQHSHVVAAASILAKVARDRYMGEICDPGYSWKSNKGYAAPAHIEALRKLGVSQHHRRAWRLPGV